MQKLDENEYSKSSIFGGTRYELIDIAIQNSRWHSFPMIIEGLDESEVKQYKVYWEQRLSVMKKERN